MNCRKVLATISITWHPFFSLPLSYSASISILPWKRESQLTHPVSSLGILWSPSLPFNLNFNALHWHRSWTILAKHQKPPSPSLSLSALHPILWLSLTFDFWISISVSAGSNGIRWLNKAPKNTSVSHTHGFLPVFSFPDVLLYLSVFSLSLSSFRNTRAKNLSGLFWTLSLSLCRFQFFTFQSQCASKSVNQICGEATGGQCVHPKWPNKPSQANRR